METISTDRMLSAPDSNPLDGKILWVPSKSAWTLFMIFVSVIGAPLMFSWDAFVVFLITTTVTICAGHSVGMHRLLIHKSFRTPKWLEYLLVYLGTLVGMAGPFGMIAAHDIRDWAQRQSTCHDFYAHRRTFFQDAWWQMHCVFNLTHPPQLVIEPDIINDRFYRFIEKYWMAQQLPWSVLFYFIGGWPWVIWGIAVRISVSLMGHWLIGHFAHRNGHQGWAVDGVEVQGYNIRYFSILTFGESLHGNHHAFPSSAKLGIESGQLDPGWWLIKVFMFLGMATNIKQPEQVGERKGLRRIETVEKIAGPQPSQR